jgi:hypothetical protein
MTIFSSFFLKGGPYIVNLFDAYAVTPALFVIVVLELIGVMFFYGTFFGAMYFKNE